MSLTDARKMYALLRDSGAEGMHSHELRRRGVSGNPSQRAKDIVTKGFGIWTAREARGGRPGSRYWLADYAPDWAVPVKPNGAEGGGDSFATPLAAPLSTAKRCRCHSDHLYDSLRPCPACGHWSLDVGKSWEGCERRACGYERTKTLKIEAADEQVAVKEPTAIVRDWDGVWRELPVGPDGWVLEEAA